VDYVFVKNWAHCHLCVFFAVQPVLLVVTNYLHISVYAVFLRCITDVTHTNWICCC